MSGSARERLLRLVAEDPGDRCSGHCCRRFALPYGPSEFVEVRDRNVADGRAGGEIERVFDMVTYLGYGLTTPEAVDHAHVYTCRNLRSDGSCGIYDHRPRMCSGYPYGRRCTFKGCTWKAVNGHHGEVLRRSDYEDAGLADPD